MSEALPAAAPQEIIPRSAAEDRVSVAPNWKLVWWRFRKNKLALVSTVILILFYLVVLAPAFFATSDPQQTSARSSFIPPQPISFFQGGNLLSAPVVEGKRNATTLRMEWQVNPDKRIGVRLFGQGFTWAFLGIKTDVHLFGLVNPADEANLHLLGTDRLGRDVWSRLVYGTRTSMTVGLIAVLLSVLLGVLLGGISGYFGGALDMVIQRVIEVLQSLPTIPIWLAMTAALPRDWPPTRVFFAITIILAFIGWTTLAREVRGRFLSLREEDFVLAAELSGASQMRIILRHMAPAFTSHIIATSTLAIPVMIINETSLSFLGLGIRPPFPSWGSMLSDARDQIATAPWISIFPGLAIFLTVLGLNLLGDGLRDILDPHSQSRKAA